MAAFRVSALQAVTSPGNYNIHEIEFRPIERRFGRLDMYDIPRRRTLIQAALFAVAVTIVFAMIYYQVGIDYFVAKVSKINPVFLALALLVNLFSWLLRTLRLRYLVNVLGCDVPYSRLFRIHTAQFFLNVTLPAKLGDVASVLALRRYTGFARSAMTIIQTRILDIATLVLFFLVAIQFVRVDSLITTLAFVLIIGLAAAFLAIFFFHKTDILETLMEKMGRVLLARLMERSKVAMRDVVKSGRLFLKARPFLSGLGLSSLIFSVDSVMALLVAVGLGIAGLSLSLSTYLVLAVAVVVGNIAKMIPLTPGSMGPYELAFYTILVTLGGVALEDAVLIAVLDHLLRNVFILAVGAPSVHLIGSHVLGRRGSIKKKELESGSE